MPVRCRRFASALSIIAFIFAAACSGGAKPEQTAPQVLDRMLEAPAGFHESDEKAVALFTDGRFDEAFAIHQQWVDKYPNFAEAHNSLAEAHRLRGNQLRRENAANYREHFEKAIPHYRRYRELAVDDEPRFRAEALAHLTEIFSPEGLNRPDQAEAAAREWVKETPKNLSAHHALARVERDTGRVTEGLATLRSAAPQASTADERDLYAGYLVDYLEGANNLPRDAAKAAIDEAEGIIEASLKANPKDTFVVDKKNRLARLRAERLK